MQVPDVPVITHHWFDVLQLRSKGYAADVTADGWSKSIVFGKQFRLTRGADPLGQPRFRLEVQ